MITNNWVRRTNIILVSNTSPAAMAERYGEVFADGSGAPQNNANWIYDPDLTAVSGFASIYWVVSGDLVSLMSQLGRDDVDADALTAQKDVIADQLDEVLTIMQAFAEVVLEQSNVHAEAINDILDAIDDASSLSEVKTAVAVIVDLSTPTLAQLKTEVKAKL